MTLPAQIAAAWPLAAWDGVHAAVAASGGADSMALLRALLELERAGCGAGRLFAVHVNHQLRGAESDADELWLREQCGKLDVPLTVRRCNAATAAVEHGDGIEAAARMLRYEALTEAAHELGVRFVATAHTRDDQVETVLFRLLRGSGLRGLAGIPRAPLSPAVTLVRPMLDCSRSDVEAHLQAVGQSWREDGSNASGAFARNRLRSELLPLVRKRFNADADAAILRAAEQAAEAFELVDAQATALLEECRIATASPDGFTLRAAPLATAPPLAAVEAIRQAWRQAGWGEQEMTHRHWRQLVAMASDDSVAPFPLPGPIRALREGACLRFEASSQR